MDYKEVQKNNLKYKKELIKKTTRQELIFKNHLDSLGIRYMFQKGFLKPFHRIVDFYIPRLRLIIEIDGPDHSIKAGQDKQKDLLWGRFTTLRITNDQVDSGYYKTINILRNVNVHHN